MMFPAGGSDGRVTGQISPLLSGYGDYYEENTGGVVAWVTLFQTTWRGDVMTCRLLPMRRHSDGLHWQEGVCVYCMQSLKLE